MMRIKIVLTFLLSCPLIHAMEKNIEEFSQKSKQPKHAIVHPFFTDPTVIPAIKKTLDAIIMYPDYSGRQGGIWSDFQVNGETITERFDTVKLTEVNGILEKRNPEVMRDYPEIQSIISRYILPQMLAIIKEKRWATVPNTIEASVYIQRCETSDAMDWHQDPGEDFGDVDQMADYSLILMLSKQYSKKHGWNGGKLRIKPGLPLEECAKDCITKIVYQYNQAVIFDNKNNSHSVTKVTKNSPDTKRDILVLMIYFGQVPMPANERFR